MECGDGGTITLQLPQLGNLGPFFHTSSYLEEIGAKNASIMTVFIGNLKLIPDNFFTIVTSNVNGNLRKTNPNFSSVQIRRKISGKILNKLPELLHLLTRNGFANKKNSEKIQQLPTVSLIFMQTDFH